jgi:hypothetical protein
MPGYTFKIVADKAGLLEYLEGLHTDRVNLAKDSAGPAKARHQGHAEGIRAAIDALTAWEEPAAKVTVAADPSGPF